MKPIDKLLALHALLGRFRFNYSSEDDLQRGIQAVLLKENYAFEREMRLDDQSRLDFLVDGEIAIETKIGGSAAQLMRQVSRYAQHESVKSILVVTNRASHMLPQSFNGKPIVVYALLDGAF